MFSCPNTELFMTFNWIGNWNAKSKKTDSWPQIFRYCCKTLKYRYKLFTFNQPWGMLVRKNKRYFFHSILFGKKYVTTKELSPYYNKSQKGTEKTDNQRSRLKKLIVLQ